MKVYLLKNQRHLKNSISDTKFQRKLSKAIVLLEKIMYSKFRIVS